MKLFLLQDVEKIGIAGEIVKVTDGFAYNFLIPRKLGVEVTPHNEAQFKNRIKVVEHRKEVIESKTSMLAEKIRSIKLTIKRKAHDGGKLFGAVAPSEIAEALAEKGFAVTKSQISTDKAIKTTGAHEVVVKLSSKLQPTFTLNVVEEKE
jgi:large subunit ribosomal protein L9